MAYYGGDFYRRGGSAYDTAGQGWIVQAAGRPGIRLKELAHLHPDSKLRADFDYPDGHSVAYKLFSALKNPV